MYLPERVLRRYALDMTTVMVEHLEKWKKDLRMLTKIYKAVGLEDTEEDREQFIEARDIFRTFTTNYEKWVYKVLLPKVKQSEQGFLHKEIASKVWTAKAALEPSLLFPTVHDYKTGKYIPAPWVLRNDRDKNIVKYNRAFNEAFKSMEQFIEWRKPEDLARVEDEVRRIGGALVLIEGHGRGEFEGDVEKTLSLLASDLGRINQAGFGAATKGLTIRLTFVSQNMIAGLYNANKDEITILPMGMGGDSDTLTHEIGHRFWWRELPTQARAHWEEVVESRSTEISQSDVNRFFELVQAKMRSTPGWSPMSAEMLAFAQQAATAEEDLAKFETLSNQFPTSSYGGEFQPSEYKSRLESYIGKKVLIDGVTDYGATSPTETFAEVFMGYVVHGPGVLTPFMRQLFKDTCRAGNARLASVEERVLDRFLNP